MKPVPTMPPHPLRARRDRVPYGVAGVGCAAMLAACTTMGPDQRTTSVPMAPPQWTLTPQAAWAGLQPGAAPLFERHESLPDGTMTLAESAIVEAGAVKFQTGTIDIDVKPLGYSDAGIIFHRQGTRSGEFVYLRANPDCPAANDCIQYVPIANGLMPWNIYADRQGPAPVAPNGWNHLHLVVAERSMAVTVNHEARPSLIVAPLQVQEGDGIALKGPAIYTNLVVRSGSPAELSAVYPPAPGTVTNWRSAPPTVAVAGPGPQAADIPSADAWMPVPGVASGLVDLGRLFGAAHAPAISTAWLKATIVASQPARRVMRIGWADQVVVFNNGLPVFRGENQYYPADERLSPGGRLEPDNARVVLDLKAGRNEIVLAVSNRWRRGVGGFEATPYGWGAEAHLDDLSGLRLPE